MKSLPAFFFGLLLSACGASFQNDPAYVALKANPPTSISVKHLPRLRRGSASCDFFKEGQADEYMTCWFPSGKPTKIAQLYFYGRIIRGGIYPGKHFITFVKL